ncbi:MAG: hypothetical protein M3342_01775 [Bacteroidota bacterium]|nr:hypothetical protein [Flavisolibacter sp.]MDQ3842731.1 hypothetical protein [Bacteroidota bacterium]MBD0284859.1 hypothetical protein [Flavisolibacter sp.]MBD0294056.1 hypothetical protein [Flavisolibacter sp.]MBD0365308.1 hypothetical protein [Flavisolibacter sp.]
MKKTGLLLLVISIGSVLFAQDYKNAAGIRISSADAVQSQSISFRHFFSEQTAVEGLFSFGDPVAVGAMLQRFTPIGASNLSWFYGAGLYIGFRKDYALGTQGILGFDYKIPSLPINFSLDWKPEINLFKRFSIEPAAVALSARFVLDK